MYGSSAENVVMWRNFLRFLKTKKVLMMYNYQVWAQSRRLKSSFLAVTLWESIFLKLLNNDDKKSKNSTVT